MQIYYSLSRLLDKNSFAEAIANKEDKERVRYYTDKQGGAVLASDKIWSIDNQHIFKGKVMSRQLIETEYGLVA